MSPHLNLQIILTDSPKAVTRLHFPVLPAGIILLLHRVTISGFLRGGLLPLSSCGEFESPCRVLHSSSPGSNFRPALTDLLSPVTWLRFLSLPSGSPSCVARFCRPVPPLTGSLSSFLWRQNPGPRGVLRSSSPCSFPLRATASPCRSAPP
jgi:hypothetical protein